MSWRGKAKSLLTNDRGKCYAPIHKEKKQLRPIRNTSSTGLWNCPARGNLPWMLSSFLGTFICRTPGFRPFNFLLTRLSPWVSQDKLFCKVSLGFISHVVTSVKLVDQEGDLI